MWQKVKNIFAVIGAVLMGACAFMVGFLCRTDKGRVRDTDDTLRDCGNRLSDIEDRIKSDEDRLRECKEILERGKKRAENKNV